MMAASSFKHLVMAWQILLKYDTLLFFLLGFILMFTFELANLLGERYSIYNVYAYVMAHQEISDEAINDCEETSSISKYIPEDLILNILPRLPVKSLIRFRSVCNLWKSIIDDPSFIDIHLSHAHPQIIFSFYKNGTTHLYSANLSGGPVVPLLNLPGYTQQDISNAGFHVLESLNGLILLTNRIYFPRDFYYICNPSTGQILMLPPSDWCANKKCDIVEMQREYYLGYDHANKKYKVLHLYEVGNFTRRRFYGSTKGFELYTVGGAGWQAGFIEETTFDRIRHNIGEETVCIHGAIHWITTRRRKELLYLAVFDLQREEFQFFSLPKAVSDDYFRLYQEYYTEIQRGRPPKFHLGQAGGNLVIVYNPDKDDLLNINLWVLEDYKNKLWAHKRVQLPCRPTLSLCPKTSTQTVEINLDPCSFPLDNNFRLIYLKERADGLIRVSNLPKWILVGEQGIGCYYPPVERVSVQTCYMESLVPLEGASSEPILLPNMEEDADGDF